MQATDLLEDAFAGLTELRDYPNQEKRRRLRMDTVDRLIEAYEDREGQGGTGRDDLIALVRISAMAKQLLEKTREELIYKSSKPNTTDPLRAAVDVISRDAVAELCRKDSQAQGPNAVMTMVSTIIEEEDAAMKN